VHLQVKDADAIPAMAEKLSSVAASYRKDEGTLAWFVHQDTKDPTKFSIVERYSSVAALETHKANPEFSAFGAFIKPLLIRPIEVATYNELPVTVPNQEGQKI